MLRAKHQIKFGGRVKLKKNMLKIACNAKFCLQLLILEGHFCKLLVIFKKCWAEKKAHLLKVHLSYNA